MGVRVALLRGVNVSGAGKLPMAEFRAMLAGMGFGGVQSCIQSGNAVFRSELGARELEAMIRDAVAARFGFAPDEAALRALALPGEGWHIGPCRFTLHTPGGFGTSKLAERLLRLLPQPMTARNLRTVAELDRMARVLTTA